MASSSSSSTCLLLLSVFTLCSLVLMASSTEENIDLTITLPLISTFTSKPYREKSSAFLPDLISASLSAGAHHLKHGKSSTTRPPLKTSLFPNRHGIHVIYLRIGTPPQKLPFMMDTGGYAVEVPCTEKYTCNNCSFSATDLKDLRIFYPERSSSAKILECRNPKCARTHFSDVQSVCPRCHGNFENCSDPCPPYSLNYGKGGVFGVYLLENLNLPGKTIRNFQLGCTISSADEAGVMGVAGMDRAMVSLPRQMGVNKFAYCLKSHDYDDTGISGKLILDYRDGETKGLSRAPFLKNPPQHPNFYYLGLEDIKIGNNPLRIPTKYLSPGSNGSNGVAIDSGFGGAGYLKQPVFEMATNELNKQLIKYKRSLEAETELGATPCFNFTGHADIKIPDLTYQFTGGANLVVPAKNYFLFDHEMSVGCFYMMTNMKSLEDAQGPSIYLGNSLQVDYYMEYDLKNERLGFRRQPC